MEQIDSPGRPSARAFDLSLAGAQTADAGRGHKSPLAEPRTRLDGQMSTADSAQASPMPKPRPVSRPDALLAPGHAGRARAQATRARRAAQALRQHVPRPACRAWQARGVVQCARRLPQAVAWAARAVLGRPQRRLPRDDDEGDYDSVGGSKSKGKGKMPLHPSLGAPLSPSQLVDLHGDEHSLASSHYSRENYCSSPPLSAVVSPATTRYPSRHARGQLRYPFRSTTLEWRSGSSQARPAFGSL